MSRFPGQTLLVALLASIPVSSATAGAPPIAAVAPIAATITEDGQRPRRSDEKRSALDTFRARHEAVVKLVKKKVDSKALQDEVDHLLDYGWLAQASLGGKKRYEKNCAPRCDEFEALLTRLIRTNYLRLVRKAGDHPVRYVDQVRGRRGAFKVTTEVTTVRNGRKQVIEVAYVMHRIEDVWQVRDIITDGMSLAKNYRFELNQVRKREGIDGIIARLERKLAEIARKD